ncbi:DUF6525 family protein [Muricoccus aerilatus]|uniref:DUF6525 family protein n=1 Tax=Muricoccus aerilatus TaxID=452982 RepID=UPI000694ACBB|nr:DUF6525 family protein [Roseomonas aerilata]
MSVAAAPPRRGILADNDVSPREEMWRRWHGDEWSALEALPGAVRRRIQEHAYDAWSVNVLMLWRMFRRRTASSARAERRLLRYLDECEAMEQAAADAAHRRIYGVPLPHVAAGASVLRARAVDGRGAGAVG